MGHTIVFGNFEWYLEKEQANILKHGVAFEAACRAFEDPQGFFTFDSKHSHWESRWTFLGKVGGRVMSVRLTFRNKSVRLVGAGFWRKGRKIYEEENTPQ